MSGLALRSALLVAALAGGCARAEPPGAERSQAGGAEQGIAHDTGVRSAAPAASASAPLLARADGGMEAGEGDAAIDWKNKAKPELSGAELDRRAKALLEAIMKDDPELARDFFFPREPFTPLKDVTDPDRYWLQLWGIYKRDIRELHRKRRDWTGASFESITLGTPPTWVKPGAEYNKIGYYRTFSARLRYSVGERKAHFELATIISWNGQWYITHLAPIKH